MAGFCWAITTSPSSADVSLERQRVNAGVGLALYRAGYRDSGSKVSKSMNSPRRMRCFTLSGIGGCWTDDEEGADTGAEAAEEVEAPVPAMGC